MDMYKALKILYVISAIDKNRLEADGIALIHEKSNSEDNVWG